MPQLHRPQLATRTARGLQRAVFPRRHEAYFQSLFQCLGDSLEHGEGVSLVIGVFKPRDHRLF